MKASLIRGVTGMVLLAGFASSHGAGQAPVPVNAKTLNNAEVQQALVGKKINSRLSNGTPYSLTFNADGTDIYKESGKDAEKEKWTLENGVVCLFPNAYPKECSQVKQANGELWFVNKDDGSVRYHFTVSP